MLFGKYNSFSVNKYIVPFVFYTRTYPNASSRRTTCDTRSVQDLLRPGRSSSTGDNLSPFHSLPLLSSDLLVSEKLNLFLIAHGGLLACPPRQIPRTGLCIKFFSLFAARRSDLLRKHRFGFYKPVLLAEIQLAELLQFFGSQSAGLIHNSFTSQNWSAPLPLLRDKAVEDPSGLGFGGAG